MTEEFSLTADTIIAQQLNQKVIKAINKRSQSPDAVLGPCLSIYKTYLETLPDQKVFETLDNLTYYLISAKDETFRIIQEKMEAKWPGDSALVARSVTNSIRRSAGTNYQALVSYALARYLYSTKSAWYLHCPVPIEFRQALAITFTGGMSHRSHSEENEAEDKNPHNIDPEEERAEGPDGDEQSNIIAQVQPDVDILLRNISWKSSPDKPEPIILLSIKTSLVDRAGMAARWKIYFDLATNPCPHRKLKGCCYDRLGINMENANLYNVIHGIVTANIYKYWFHDERYKQGELESGQTRSNTYMFEYKFTTRNDGIAITPEDWRQFPQIIPLLNYVSEEQSLKK
jgi:hypothetical protein